MKNPYVPVIKENIELAGIAVETVLPNQTVKILTKAFIDSYDPRFDKYSNNLLVTLLSSKEIAFLDNLLVVIKPDNNAYIYRVFPLIFKILAKKNIAKGTLVTTNDIADISSVIFQDDFFKIDIDDNDKIILFLRNGHRFGLYFDLSGNSTNDFRAKEIAYYYKSFIYKGMFDFLSQDSNLESLINDGWFPFIRIIGSPFEKLIEYYSEDTKYESYINNLMDIFPSETITAIMNSWWGKSVFKDKREIIEAGIQAYNNGGYINCIKNLASEIEGLIRNAMYLETHITKPTMKDLKDFLVKKGVEKFNDDRALGFPVLFSKYLDESIFVGFDISDATIVTSRHSVGHGVARFDNYTKIRAFQLILTLDQMFFYL